MGQINRNLNDGYRFSRPTQRNVLNVSDHVAAAVDVDRLAGDVRSGVAGEEENRTDEVFWLQDVAQWIGSQPLP